MITDQNFNDIETTDIKASSKVSQILWALLDAVSDGDENDEALSFYDKELLEDVLRFGTIAEVARRKEESYNKLRVKLIRILYHISDKIEQINTLKEENLKLKESLAVKEGINQKQNLELIDIKTQLFMAQEINKESFEKLSKTEEKLAQKELQLTQKKKEIVKLKKSSANSEAAKKEAKLMQNRLRKQTLASAVLDKANTELKVKLEIADEKLNRAMEVIKNLRLQTGQNYKVLYESALETIERQRKENETFLDFLDNMATYEPCCKGRRYSRISERKLATRVGYLEKKLKEYKSKGISALLDFEPELL